VQATGDDSFDFIRTQRGMFSLLVFPRKSSSGWREKHHITCARQPDESRGIMPHNVAYVADAIAAEKVVLGRLIAERLAQRIHSARNRAVRPKSSSSSKAQPLRGSEPVQRLIEGGGVRGVRRHENRDRDDIAQVGRPFRDAAEVILLADRPAPRLGESPILEDSLADRGMPIADDPRACIADEQLRMIESPSSKNVQCAVVHHARQHGFRRG